MVLRIWRGWTTPENGDAYEAIVSQQVLPGIAARDVTGYLAAYLLRADRGDRSSSRRPCWRLRRAA